MYDGKTLRQRYILAKGLLSVVGGSAFSPDGKRIVAVVDDTAYVYDVESGERVKKIPVPTSPTGGDHLPSTIWMPDDKTVAVTLSTAAVGFFGLAGGTLRGTIVGVPNGQGLAVSANGHHRGTPKIENDLVHVVHTKYGTAILTPAEFAKRFGWRNDPERVVLTAGR